MVISISLANTVLVFSETPTRRQRLFEACSQLCANASILSYSSFSDLTFAFSSISNATVVFDLQGMQDSAKAAISILRNLNSVSKLVAVRAESTNQELEGFFDLAVSIADLEAGLWPNQTTSAPTPGNDDDSTSPNL